MYSKTPVLVGSAQEGRLRPPKAGFLLPWLGSMSPAELPQEKWRHSFLLKGSRAGSSNNFLRSRINSSGLSVAATAF